MRIQGLTEDTHGSVDAKILALCKDQLEVQPPLDLADIEVAHRLPYPKGARNPTEQNVTGDTPPTLKPRSVIVKFASRRVKSRFMGVRKGLKNLNRQEYVHPIYFQDDLTAKRAKMAYTARHLKKDSLINDTWVWDSKVLVKDRHYRIHNIKCLKDLDKFRPA